MVWRLALVFVALVSLLAIALPDAQAFRGFGGGRGGFARPAFAQGGFGRPGFARPGFGRPAFGGPRGAFAGRGRFIGSGRFSAGPRMSTFGPRAAGDGRLSRRSLNGRHNAGRIGANRFSRTRGRDSLTGSRTNSSRIKSASVGNTDGNGKGSGATGCRGDNCGKGSGGATGCRGDNCGKGNGGATGCRGDNCGKGSGSTTGCRTARCGNPSSGEPGGRPPRFPGNPPVQVGSVPPFVPPVGYVPPTIGSNSPPAGVASANPPPPPPSSGSGGQGSSASQPTAAAFSPPPSGETRFVPDQVICVLRATMSDDDITAFLREYRMARTSGGRRRIGLIGGDFFRYRITDGRDVPSMIAALARDPRVISAQPNYLYQLAEVAVQPLLPPPPILIPATPPQTAPVPPPVPGTDANTVGVSLSTQSTPPAAAATESNDNSLQYVIGKLHLRQAHKLTKGDKVLIAVIDSEIDANHPEIKGSIVKQIDVLDGVDRKPHAHGTAMAGAIVARGQLMGVAPAAPIIAIRAFAPKTKASGSGTSYNLAQAIDRAVEAGAQVINMSFGGPEDPLLLKAVQAAHAHGVIMVAAAGNEGPRAAPDYPAAYPDVIAVTATDDRDQIYQDANHGNYIAVAAPGVDVLVPAPNGGYGMTTGTSVAAAHVSGVAALLIARNHAIKADAVRQILLRSAHAIGPQRDDTYGAGIADAYQAIVTMETGVAAGISASNVPAKP
jgi:hypothetical protein